MMIIIIIIIIIIVIIINIIFISTKYLSFLRLIMSVSRLLQSHKCK